MVNTTVSCAVLYYKSANSSIFELFLAAGVSVGLSFLMEKDSRDIWHLYSSYLKSDSLFKNLWMDSPRPNFILDSHGDIICRNKMADFALKEKLGYSVSVDGLNFNSAFYLKNFKELIEQSAKGQILETDLFTRKHFDINKDSLTSLGYLLIASSAYWNHSNYSRIILTDISLLRSSKIILIEALKPVFDTIERCRRDLANLSRVKEAIQPEQMTQFFNMLQASKNVLVLERRFFSINEPRIEHFDANIDLYNVIEETYLKAKSADLSFIYTQEQGVPASIIGDKFLHAQLLWSIFGTVINSAVAGSEVSIFLQVAVIFM
jgi:hypothetical protein